MNRTIITSLGDTWEIADNIVTSNNSGRWYGLSDDMSNFLEKSVEDRKFANALRKIDIAEIVHDGTAFVMPCKGLTEWGEVYRFEDPCFYEDIYERKGIVFLSDISYQLVPQFGQFELFKRNANGIPETLGIFAEPKDAFEFMTSDTIPEPLPNHNGRDSVFIDLPLGLHAEIISEVFNPNGEYPNAYIHAMVLDKDNSLVLEMRSTDPQTLIEMRDNRLFLEQILDERIGEKPEELKKFSDNSLSKFDDLDDLKIALSLLKPGETIKVASHDNKYEMAVQWEPLNSLRTVDGKKIYSGEELLINPEILESWKVDSVLFGKEKGYCLSIKKTEGAFVFAMPPMIIDPQKLFSFMADPVESDKNIKLAKDRLDNNRLHLGSTLDLTDLHMIIAASQGTFENIEYLNKKEVPVKEMVRRLENQYRRAENQFLNMNY